MAALTARMGFFHKKPDPLSERSRQLTAKIAALESKIKQLNQQAEPADPRRLRSTAYPPGSPAAARPAPAARHGEPVFERVDQKPIKDAPEPPPTPGHFNELGARKFDLLGLIERIKRYFRGPPAANPKLLSYLAAGNIQGLRPLRYEKRVARNRFVALALVLVIVLFGLFCFLARKH
jgi:cell division protein FtsB